MSILLSRDEFELAIGKINERLMKMETDLGEILCLKFNSINERLSRIEQALVELNKPCECEEAKEVKKVIKKK